MEPIVCFLDESATDAKDSDHAVLGGIVINRKHISRFEAEWNAMLCHHGARAGLHMRQLGPRGRYPHLVDKRGSAVLANAVKQINRHRIFTFGASRNNREHELQFSQNLRKEHLSVYALTFMMAVEMNRASAVRAGYSGRIDYVLDQGNQFRKQIEGMHGALRTIPELARWGVGSLEFRKSTETPALQAADVIVWSTRRRKAGKTLKGMYSPLNRLFDDSYADSPIPEDVMKNLSERFAQLEKDTAPNHAFETLN